MIKVARKGQEQQIFRYGGSTDYQNHILVTFRGMSWIRSWSIHFKEEGRIILKIESHLLETKVMEITSKSRWNTLKRIKD
jgi:hypothetical protein